MSEAGQRLGTLLRLAEDGLELIDGLVDQGSARTPSRASVIASSVPLAKRQCHPKHWLLSQEKGSRASASLISDMDSSILFMAIR
jgi:hypothetical protein